MGCLVFQFLSKRYMSHPQIRVTRKFCSHYKAKEDINNYNKKSPPWNVMFFGTDQFSLRSLELLHKEQTKGGLIERLDVVSVALKKSIPAVWRYCQKEGLEVIEWPVRVPHRVYDVGIVASFGHLIPASVINAFPMGIINVHGSLLPRWRGAAPVIHALLNQDQQTGITLMRIAPHRFDVGHIVSKVMVPVEWNIKSKDLTEQLAVVGAQELLSILPNLPQHLREAHPQPSEGVTKAPKVSEAASRVQWSEWSCSDIQAHYRALDDYSPLWSHWQGMPTRLRGMVMHKEWSSSKRHANMLKTPESENIRESSVSELNNNIRSTSINDFAGNLVIEDSVRTRVCDNVDVHNQNLEERVAPGSVVYDKRMKEIRIRCRDGWVAFQEFVLKGRKRMTGRDFYNGFMSKVSKDLHRFT